MPGKVKWLCLLLALMQVYTANAQQYAFQVTFTDKNNTPYSLSSPLTYLSPRAVARRTTQGIAVDSTDLPVNPAYIDSVINLTGGVFHEASKWLNMCMVLVPDSAQMHMLAGKPYIKEVKLVGYYSTNLHLRKAGTAGQITASPTQKTTSSADCSYYGNTCNQTQIVNGHYLHNNGYNGEGMLIAVLDAGFLGSNANPGFDSLLSSGRLLDSFDFVWHNENVLQQDNHGSMVLSTMAGYWPGTFVGAAPKAMYALYLTEYNPDDQPLELDNLLCAAERADSLGADVITESLGYDVFNYPPGAGQTFATDLDGKTTIGAQAANMATKKGMLFVATAGNDGGGIPGWGNHIMTPGDADSALTIGSVNSVGTPSGFSSYGPNAAGQVKPDVCAMGEGETLLIGAGYGSITGTSFSTPQVAGWAACLWQAHPNATPAQIRQAIIKCASSYTSPGAQLGYGIPDFECTTQLLSIRDTPPFTSANWVIATPNPFSDQLTVSVFPNAAGNVAFRLMDMAGREIFATHYTLNKGYNAPVSIPIAELPVGMYILKVVATTQQQVLKLNKRP